MVVLLKEISVHSHLNKKYRVKLLDIKVTSLPHLLSLDLMIVHPCQQLRRIESNRLFIPAHYLSKSEKQGNLT
jgi:hypothetical protein